MCNALHQMGQLVCRFYNNISVRLSWHTTRTLRSQRRYICLVTKRMLVCDFRHILVIFLLPCLFFKALNTKYTIENVAQFFKHRVTCTPTMSSCWRMHRLKNRMMTRIRMATIVVEAAVTLVVTIIVLETIVVLASYVTWRSMNECSASCNHTERSMLGRSTRRQRWRTMAIIARRRCVCASRSWSQWSWQRSQQRRRPPRILGRRNAPATLRSFHI